MSVVRFASTCGLPGVLHSVSMSTITSARKGESFGRLQVYGIEDQEPNLNETALDRVPIDEGRYRLLYQSRTKLTDDTSAVVDFNKLSDQYFLQDFYPNIFCLRSAAGYLFRIGEAR